jgi:translation initiation factor 1 (eIF-1/SUI1)
MSFATGWRGSREVNSAGIEIQGDLGAQVRDALEKRHLVKG